MVELSVLLPSYEAAAYLPACLESLISQSFGDFEIIAVDDGSRDDTRELLARTARSDSRLHVLATPHRGLTAALDAAARAARGRFLARMDADDIAHPERLARERELLLEDESVQVVASRVRLFPRASLSEGLIRYETWVNSLLTHDEIVRDAFVESPLPHPSVMMRRQAFERAGGYVERGWPEDYDLWMRMVGQGYRFAKLPQYLLDWRDRPDRVSRVDSRFSATRFMDLKEHYLVKRFLEKPRTVGIWGAGPIGKRWARRLARRGLEVSHFVDVDPRKVGKRIHGAEVLPAGDVQRLLGGFVIVAVGALSRGSLSEGERRSSCMPARIEIREQLKAAGFEELRDFVCVA